MSWLWQTSCIKSTHPGKTEKLAAFKIDFSKAFDRLSRNFITALMRRMQFPDAFVDLIYQCLSTVEYHFMVNNQEIFTLEPNCDIRQGNPLSPYLYILVTNVFSCLITEASSTDHWKGINKSELLINFVSGLDSRLTNRNPRWFLAPILLTCSVCNCQISWGSTSPENLENIWAPTLIQVKQTSYLWSSALCCPRKNSY